MFPPLVKAQLDEFREYWNTHLVTKQEGKLMLSAHIPKLLMEHPAQGSGIDCLVPVPSSATQTLWDFVTENVGPREDFFWWVDDDFWVVADEIYTELGSPKLTLENSWYIFGLMVPQLEQLVVTLL